MWSRLPSLHHPLNLFIPPDFWVCFWSPQIKSGCHHPLILWKSGLCGSLGRRCWRVRLKTDRTDTEWMEPELLFSKELIYLPLLSPWCIFSIPQISDKHINSDLFVEDSSSKHQDYLRFLIFCASAAKLQKVKGERTSLPVMEFLVNEDLGHVSGSAPPLLLSGVNPSNLWFVLLLYLSSRHRFMLEPTTSHLWFWQEIWSSVKVHIVHIVRQTNAVKRFLPQNSTYCKCIQFSLLFSLVVILWISWAKYFWPSGPVTLIDGSKVTMEPLSQRWS